MTGSTDLMTIAGEGAELDESFGGVTVSVPADRWLEVARALRDDPRVAARFFDWLSAYDDEGAGLAVVLHVWSRSHRRSVLLRARVARTGASLPTVSGVWPGALWHERETFEMFGIDFVGHPDLVPLLLPDGFEGNPLRKEFVLASRVARAWPGRKEPGESDRDLTAGEVSRRGRRRAEPPGVPEPGTWGPPS
jgi:NADH-quinone oxidoreductase subunit C